MKRFVYKIGFTGHFIRTSEGDEKWVGLPNDIQKALESESLKSIVQTISFDTYEVEIKIKSAKGK